MKQGRIVRGDQIITLLEMVAEKRLVRLQVPQ